MYTPSGEDGGKKELHNPYRVRSSYKRVIFKFEAWFFAIPYKRARKNPKDYV